MSDFVLPTRIAVHRYQQMKVEAIINTAYQITQDQTPMQVCQGGMPVGEVIDTLELEGEEAEIAEDLLEDALSGGELDEAYGPRGGILCLLLPTADPQNDFILHQVQSQTSGAMTHNAFVNSSNEIFSGLSPAQVWAGAGPIEWELAQSCLNNLWEKLADQKFKSTGATNTAWLGKLRLWSYNPTPGHQGRVIDIIHDERNRNLKLRREHCEANGIDTAFAALDE